MNICFDNVQKNLGGHEILTGFSFEVQERETFVIIGRSGTGKSVTLKHIVGLMHPDVGRVLIDGRDMQEFSSAQLWDIRKNFGYLFQSGALINWMNVEENVMLPLKEHTRMTPAEIRKRTYECLDLVEMGDAGKVMPSELSGGMKKRVGLARAIVQHPKVILYDEPTSGLDPVMTGSINQLIRNLQDELAVTSIVVTHDMTSAYAVGDRICMLYHGKSQFVGTAEEVANTKDEVVSQFIHGRTDGPITALRKIQDRRNE